MKEISTMLPPYGKAAGGISPTEQRGAADKDGKQARCPLILCRQLCFFAAFVLPVSKLLEAPSLLAYFSKGDLLLPAFFHYVLQTGAIAALLYVCSKSERPLYQRLCDVSKPLARTVYALLAAYYVFADLFPLLDLERFVYTAFFDTPPAVSAFLPFFLLSAFLCVKDEKAVGRSADLCMPIFLFAFSGLIFMALGEADFSELLPLFGTSAKADFKAFYQSLVHFSDAPLILPLLSAYEYRKGDGKKITAAYAGGGGFVLLFLAVFYGVFGPLAPRETYAFDKIARYFSALDVVGRVDLLLVYLITVVLLYAYALPLQLSVICLTAAFKKERYDVELNGADAAAKAAAKTEKQRLIFSLSINGTLLLFVLFCSKYYNALYRFIAAKMFWIFPLFSVGLPLSFLFLKGGKPSGKTSGKAIGKTPFAATENGENKEEKTS
ncbi:MAG: GerAB/ArcD/ProY family transporter [Candidatus Scatosoma sp.]